MLATSYILLSALMSLIILAGIWISLNRFYAQKRDVYRPFIKSVLILIFWFVYLCLISNTGLLRDLSLPPKFPLLIFGPIIALICIAWFKYQDDPRLQALPRSWPIYYQSFRVIVETLLHYTFLAAIIPASATFNGLNFDIIMGITAPFVAYFFIKNNQQNRWVKWWNILGILMILFVAFIVASSIYFPGLWGANKPLVDFTFIEMPYLLLAGFLAPSAIIVHFISLMQRN